MLKFTAMTDAEINRWAAERDGLADWEKSFCDKDRALTAYLEWVGEIGNSADACLDLLERWGLFWEKRIRKFDGVEYVLVWVQRLTFDCVITDTCKFPRALLNAACAAKEATGCKAGGD